MESVGEKQQALQGKTTPTGEGDLHFSSLDYDEQCLFADV